MPSGFHASEPSASLCAGTPKRITPGTPASARTRTSLRRRSRVCWTTPGSEAIGWGESMPSRTNSGATEIVDRQVRLGDEAAQGGAASETPGTLDGEAHLEMLEPHRRPSD